MRKTIIFTVLLLIAVSAAAILYFSSLGTDSRHSEQALSHIPADAAMVAGFKYDDSFRDIFSDYPLFKALTGEEKAAEVNVLQSLIISPAPHTGGQNIFLSVHHVKDSTELLWILTFNQDFNEENLIKTINKSTNVRKLTKKGDYYQIYFKKLQRAFYLHLNSGFALGCFSEFLIRQATDLKSEKIDNHFINEISSTSQKNTNSPFNLFINHHRLYDFAGKLLREEPGVNLRLMKELKGFTTLNMNFKSDALMFNGISKTDIDEPNYLNLFLHQSPVNNNISQTFPVNTANFLAFGLSDNELFFHDLHELFRKRGDLQALTEQFDLLNSSTGISIDRDLKNLWGNEFAVVQLSTREKLGIFEVADTSKLNFYLRSIRSSYSDKIKRFNNSNILYYFFGDVVKELQRPYYTIADNYLVAANSPSTLKRFLSSYSDLRLLVKDQAYANFSQFTGNKSNISYFIQNKNSLHLLSQWLKGSFFRTINDDSYGIKNFYGLSLQWSSAHDYFITNLYANYINPDSLQHQALWKYEMKGVISRTPQVFEGVSGQHFILVQDRINNLFSLTTTGERIWVSQLDGQILGTIKQLDDHSLVFNTANKIYRTDTHGNNFPGFPVAFSKKASGSVTFTSQDPSTCYLVVPCYNTIAAFAATGGESVSEWNKTLDADILFDLKTANVGDTNYLIAGTQNGKFYFFGLNGSLIAKTEDPSGRKYSNPISIETRSSTDSSRIITSDSTGSISSIYFNGKISKKSISSWSAAHFFDYKNITESTGPEFIYLDKNQLYVYNADSTLAFNYEFPYPIPDRPKFFKKGQNNYQLGISSPENHLLYLFNEDGTLAKGFPFKGEPDFYVGPINKDDQRYLICGDRDNYLYVYKL